jgi:Ca2+-binding RTX toxin-like protein
MNGAFREIGAGVYDGLFTSGMTTFNSVMATQDFARSGTSVFLTGVAYTDALVADDFYTVGEAAANVTVSAVRTSDGATFSTATWSSGGYSLALPAGTYTVSATNGQVGGTIVHSGVVIGSENVKRDFRPDMAVPPFATLDGAGALTINGTDAADAMSLSLAANTITVTRNGASQMFTAASVTSILLYLGAGNDQLGVGDGIMGLYCDGGEGNDHLAGGQFNDTLTGNAGHDKLLGGAGDDRLNGSGGHDKLWGELGVDRLYGHAGYDMLDGGAHVDRMWGDAGIDTLYGQGSNDQFYTLDGEADALYGGSGTDLAQRDDGDLISSVETRL